MPATCDSLSSGTWQTRIIVWNVRDATKARDRFWWSAEEVGRLRRSIAPGEVDCLVIAGTPKGRSLAVLRREFGGDEGEIFRSGPIDEFRPMSDQRPEQVALFLRSHTPPYQSHRLSLNQWRNANPETTYLIVSHRYLPTPEEQEAWVEVGDRLPPEVDELRQDWVAALQSEDEAEPALREQYDEELAALGHFKLAAVSAWHPAKAVEINPGVFVQDETPANS